MKYFVAFKYTTSGLEVVESFDTLDERALFVLARADMGVVLRQWSTDDVPQNRPPRRKGVTS